MKKTALLLALTATAFAGKGQNLVPNGDFEQYSGCPTGYGQIDYSSFWINPTVFPGSGGSPDYFNQCSTNPNVGVPNNVFGYQPAHSGNGYIGIVTGRNQAGSGYNNYREYVEVPLSSTLSANLCYHFEMYISLANQCKYTSDVTGVYFSDTIITGINNYFSLSYTPQININWGLITDTLNWILITAGYTATGGENYLMIGNFKDSSQTNTVLVNGGSGLFYYSYFYIDDVSLTPCTGIEEQNQNQAFTIYPNPVKDQFMVSGLKFPVKEKTEIIITDASGRKVLQQTKMKAEVFNIQSLNAGIYFVEINDGKNVYRKKIIKE
jgi:hypothetical protein